MIGPIEQKRNFELIKAMHAVVTALNNDDEVEPWFLAYPDGAGDDELMEMAGDGESMDFLCANFRRRIENGGKDGWFTQPNSEFSESFDRRSRGIEEPGHVYGAVRRAG